MKHIRIEKTDTGYILRQSFGYTLLRGLTATTVLVLSAVVFSIPWWARDGHLALDFRNFLCWLMSLAVFALGAYAFWLTVGTKMVFDEEGVHFYRLFFHVSTMPWREIKSWGVMYMSGVRYLKRAVDYRYEFFVSSDRNIASMRARMSIELSPRESVTILKEKLMDFCVDRIPTKAKRVGMRIGGRELVKRKGNK